MAVQDALVGSRERLADQLGVLHPGELSLRGIGQEECPKEISYSFRSVGSRTENPSPSDSTASLDRASTPAPRIRSLPDQLMPAHVRFAPQIRTLTRVTLIPNTFCLP